MNKFNEYQYYLILDRLTFYKKDKQITIAALAHRISENYSANFSINRMKTYKPITEGYLGKILKKQRTKPSTEIIESFKDLLVNEHYLELSELDNPNADFKIGFEPRILIPDQPKIQFYKKLNSHTLVRRYERKFTTKFSVLSFAPPESMHDFITVTEHSFLRRKGESISSLRNRTSSARPDHSYTWIAKLVPNSDNFFDLHFLPESWEDNVPRFLRLSTKKTPISSLIVTKEIQPNTLSDFTIYLDPPNSFLLKKSIKYSTLREASKHLFSKTAGRHTNTHLFKGDRMDDLNKIYEFETKTQKRLNNQMFKAAHSLSATELLMALIKGADINALEPETGRAVSHICSSNMDNSSLSIIYSPSSAHQAIAKNLKIDFTELGGEKFALLKWKTATAKFDPIQRDEQGNIPSSYYPAPDHTMVENQALNQIFEIPAMQIMYGRILKKELDYIEQKGLDVKDFFGENYQTTRLDAVTRKNSMDRLDL